MPGMERGWEVAVAREGWSLGQEPRDSCQRNQNEKGVDGEAREGRWDVVSKEPMPGAHASQVGRAQGANTERGSMKAQMS